MRRANDADFMVTVSFSKTQIGERLRGNTIRGNRLERF